MFTSRLRGIEMLEQKQMLTTLLQSPTADISGEGGRQGCEQTSFAPLAGIQADPYDGIGQTSLAPPVAELSGCGGSNGNGQGVGQGY